ncbi:MAG: glycosyltransferase family 4 protein [Pseudomonadota bacterium]
MRILFLSQWFQPEQCFKGLPFAKALTDRGHRVEVLTGFPNYPTGKVYQGYRVRLFQRETMEGIRVNRVALYPSCDRSVLRRAINYLSFAFSAFFIGTWMVSRPDIIYVCNLVTLAPTAFLFRFLFGSKIVIDVLDIWPESIASSRLLNNKFTLHILDEICKWVYRKADKLVAPSPGIKRALINKGVSPEKIDVIYHWCDESSIRKEMSKSCLVEDLELSDKFIILFAGTMGLVQGLDTLLDCARICMETLPNVQFLLVGGGFDRSRLEQRKIEMGLDNVTFLPSRSIELMGEIFAISDALIVHLKDSPLFRVTIPSKTHAYLYIGKPIIMAILGDAGDLVKQAGAGVVCAPENPKDMAKAIETLWSMSDEERNLMGLSGSQYYNKFLSFTSGVDKFEKLMLGWDVAN